MAMCMAIKQLSSWLCKEGFISSRLITLLLQISILVRKQSNKFYLIGVKIVNKEETQIDLNHFKHTNFREVKKYEIEITWSMFFVKLSIGDVSTVWKVVSISLLVDPQFHRSLDLLTRRKLFKNLKFIYSQLANLPVD